MIDCQDPEYCGVARHRSLDNCKAAQYWKEHESQTDEESAPESDTIPTVLTFDSPAKHFQSKRSSVIKKNVSSRRRKR